MLHKSIQNKEVIYLEEVADEWHRSIFEVVHNVDGNLFISIPEDLGGGEIIEEDYELSNVQLAVLDELLMTRNVEAVIMTPKGRSKGRTFVRRNLSDETKVKVDQLEVLHDSPKFDQDGIAATSQTIQAWETLEALRILKPLSDNLNSAIAMGRVLTDHQTDFLKRYDFLTMTATRSVQLGENPESHERLSHTFDELTELEY